jgi:hypothetical protein
MTPRSTQLIMIDALFVRRRPPRVQFRQRICNKSWEQCTTRLLRRLVRSITIDTLRHFQHIFFPLYCCHGTWHDMSFIINCPQSWLRLLHDLTNNEQISDIVECYKRTVALLRFDTQHNVSEKGVLPEAEHKFYFKCTKESISTSLTPTTRVLTKLMVAHPMKKFPALYGTPKFHYRVHKSLLMTAILSQMNPVHISYHISLRSKLMLLQCTLRFPNWLHFFFLNTVMYVHVCSSHLFHFPHVSMIPSEEFKQKRTDYKFFGKRVEKQADFIWLYKTTDFEKIIYLICSINADAW